mmetsp:Transcript_39675/g.114512  ORF Transcript_39675/g.114512 Transcript_39675/m.114512 type:complete len:273 (-) Transcript_39675:111-929(-)
MQSVEHVVQLEVVLDRHVRPRRISPVAAKIVLLRAVAPAVPGVVSLRELLKHELQHLEAWPPEHDAGVDARALAPRVGLAGGGTREEASAVDGVAVLVRPAPVVVHAAPERGRRGEPEEVVDVPEDQEIDVQHQDLLKVHEAHAAQLREDLLETRVLLLPAQRRRGLHVLHEAAVPDLREQLDQECRDVIGMEAHERVWRPRLPDGVPQHQRPQHVGARGAPERDDVGVLALGAWQRLLHGRLFAQHPRLHRPLAAGAEAAPALRAGLGGGP